MNLHKFRQLQKSEEGFTLIELLVVILIIGILSAIAIPVFLNQRKAANDAAVESDIRGAALAAETWMVKNPHSVTPPQVQFKGPVKGNYGGQEFNVSPGVTISLVNWGRESGSKIGHYVIYAYHENGSRHTSCNSLRYSSDEGGYSNTHTNAC